MISKTTVLAAGAVGLFLAYCVYFDKKRRNDPLYKEKIKKKRNQEKKKKQDSSKSPIDLPDLRDYHAVQKFFIDQVQLGEDLLAQGDIENGIEHISNAVAVCGQPQQLLQVLQQTLPPQVFHLLLQRLPIVSQKMASLAAEATAEPPPTGSKLTEDDVE